MDVDLYLEVADLFRFRWDPAILDALSDQPSRFRALARRLHASTDGYIDDSALTRSLDRLRRSRFVEVGATDVGRRRVSVYRLTVRGSDLLDIYRALLATYERLRGETPM